VLIDPCGINTGKVAGTVGTPAQHAPVDNEKDDYSYGDRPKEEPAPANPVTKVCELNKVQIVVGMPASDSRGNMEAYRHFGHFIMDRIPIVVVLSLDPSVEIDFSSLVKQKVLGFNGSDFLLAKPAAGETEAVIVNGPKEVKGRKLYKLELLVQSMVFKASIPFTLDLRYATEKLPDDSGYAWKTLTTPDFLISHSYLADNGVELQEGDLDHRATRLSWMTMTALALGTFLTLLIPGMTLVKRFSRTLARPMAPPHRLAWKVFETQYRDGKRNGFRRKHMKAMAHALRRYLSTTPDYPALGALTFMEMEARFQKVESFAIVKSTLELLERDFFQAQDLNLSGEAPTCLTKVQLQHVFDAIQLLVPRPWDTE
jgi:hypothetical protein